MKIKNLLILLYVILVGSCIHAMHTSRLFQSFYNVLGVSENATQQTIRANYLRLAKKYHPDRATGDARKFKEIEEAYTTLKDSNLRSRYDQKLRAEQAQEAESVANKRTYESEAGNSGRKAYESGPYGGFRRTRQARGEYKGNTGRQESLYEKYKKLYRNIEMRKDVLGVSAFNTAVALVGLVAYTDYRKNLEEYYKTFSIYEKMSEEEKIKKSEHNAEIVKKTKRCHACYLENTDLQNINLVAADFSGAFLAGTQFAKSDLTGTNFKEAILKNTDFNQATLKNANFHKVKIWGSCDFKKADLDKANFTELIFLPPSLNYEPGSVVDYTIDFSDAKLTDANFTGVGFYLIKKVTFARADLTGANFKGATLIGVDFTGADLSNADLTDAHIEKANFSGSNLKGTKLDVDKLDYVTWLNYKLQNAF